MFGFIFKYLKLNEKKRLTDPPKYGKKYYLLAKLTNYWYISYGIFSFSNTK